MIGGYWAYGVLGWGGFWGWDPNDIKENLLSRETGLFYGALILIASALVVFVGTSAPIIGKSVEVSFYNKR
ncbi:MAG: hypothetical protein ACYCVH_08435 [Ignavibacteriaceae bacterium]